MKNEFSDLIIKTNPNISISYIANILSLSSNEFLAEEGNSLFIVNLKGFTKYIRITHKIKSNGGCQRIKMYYASKAPENFCEEKSLELGFLDGETYSEIVKLIGGSDDLFRFDLGGGSFKFVLEDFKIEIPSKSEIINMKLRMKLKKANSLRKCISNRRISMFTVFSKIRKYGFIGVLNKINELANNLESLDAKSTVQVVEPYEVIVKKDLQANRKKVLHIIENFYTGGSSRLIIDIIENYGHKFENKIFTMAYRGQEEFLGVDVTVINVDNKKETLKLISDYSPDIIHVHIWQGEWYHKVFDILGEVKNCRIVENINTPIEPILKDYIDKYVFVSNYVLEKFHDINDPKSVVIYPGSNFDMFTRELKDNYLEKDTIGMVYRLDYDKLNQNSIDVFIKTIEKRPQTKAIIVGGGPQYKNFVDKVKKHGLMDNFTFTGYVPYVELPNWYEKFTVFVAPVWKESFGQVSPFAMSMGIPVSGYNIGALSEIIGNEKLLAEPDNSDQSSDILVELLDNYDWSKEIGKFNRIRAHEKFGVAKMVDDYNNLYDELLNI